jgi:hypothetical protein
MAMVHLLAGMSECTYQSRKPGGHLVLYFWANFGSFGMAKRPAVTFF